jgi:4-alpha-glucanotransferase
VAAEDLGDITPAVLDLRDQFGFPGMKVLLFAFGSGAENPYLPHNFDRNCVVYTGTHDNNTTVGWFYGGRISEAERQGVLNYLGHISPEGVQWAMIRLALQSVANLAVIPLQDIFGLGEDSRMNLPGTMEQNWGWRYSAEMLHDGLAHQLADLTVTFGRISPAELDASRQHLG